MGHMVPSATLGLLMFDQEFRSCLRYWLGVPLFGCPYQCPEYEAQADTMGDHVGGGGNGDRIFCYNNIRDVLFSAALSAVLSPSKEASGIVPNSCSCPADILLPNWSQGHHAALDISVISPLQQLTMSGAASFPGHALQVCTQRKLSSHLSTCRSAGIDFIPMVVEALEGWSSEAVISIKRIREALDYAPTPLSCLGS